MSLCLYCGGDAKKPGPNGNFKFEAVVYFNDGTQVHDKCYGPWVNIDRKPHPAVTMEREILGEPTE